MQKAFFPMKDIKISQGYGDKSSTHKLSYAFDLSGKDSGKDDVYAPFDCKITKLFKPADTTKSANTVWLTSLDKVKCANGVEDFLTISITHPSEISDMKLGAIYRQGEKICTEGKTGNASGNHIHLEVSLGTDASWTLKRKGAYTEYVITNNVKPEEYLFVSKKSTILSDTYKGIKYNLIWETDEIIVDKPIDEAVYYIVKKGDNLTTIAKNFNTTVNNIMILNRSEISNPDLIFIDQKIRVK